LFSTADKKVIQCTLDGRKIRVWPHIDIGARRRQPPGSGRPGTLATKSHEKCIDFRGHNPFAERILKEGGKCKYCNSQRIVKDGHQPNGKQRYKCNDCGHKFVEPDRLVKTHEDKRVIAIGLELYFEGLSLRKVCRMLKKLYGVSVEPSTVWRWMNKYTPLAKKFIQSLTPSTKRGMFHCDETCIVSKGKKNPNFWYWDGIDRDTRFVMGSHLTQGFGKAGHTANDAAAFFEDLKIQYKARPKHVIVDGLAAYKPGLKKVYGGWTAHRHIKFISWAGIAKEMPSNNNRIERHHNYIKSRTKVMRGMQNPWGILEGLNIHYNFIRFHMTLKTTPARIAGIRLPFTDGWGDMIRWSTYHDTLSNSSSSS